MKKKLISALLMGALFVSSTSVFVSCKDYDDDINGLKSQINELSTQVGTKESTIQNSISTLDGQLKTLKSTLSNELSTGDQATLIAAIAAIDEAKAELNRTISAKADATDIAALTLKNADQDVAINAAQADAEQALKQLEALINAFTAAASRGDNAAQSLADIQKAVDGIKQMQADLADLNKKYNQLDTKVTTAIADIADLKAAVAGQQAALEALAGESGDMTQIAANITAVMNKVSELEKQMAESKETDNTVAQQIAAITKQVEELEKKIASSANADLNTLTVALAKALRGLVLRPDTYYGGIEGISVYTYVFPEEENNKHNPKDLYRYFDRKGEINISDIGTAQYHVNPSNVDLTNYKIDFYNWNASIKEPAATERITPTRSGVAGGISPVYATTDELLQADPNNLKNGILSVPFTADAAVIESNLNKGIGTIASLSLTLKDKDGVADTTVNSDYAIVVPEYGYGLLIGDNTFPVVTRHLDQIGYDGGAVNSSNLHRSFSFLALATTSPTHSIKFDESFDITKVLESRYVPVKADYDNEITDTAVYVNHNQHKAIAEWNGTTQKKDKDGDASIDKAKVVTLTKTQFEKLGLRYEIQPVDYTLGTNQTGETVHLELLTNEEGHVIAYPRNVTADGKTITGKTANAACVGRQPIVCIMVKDKKDRIVSFAYMKFLITPGKEVEPEALEVDFDIKDIWVNCKSDGGKVTWSEIEYHLFDQLLNGMSKKTFDMNYIFDYYAQDTQNVDVSGATYSKVTRYGVQYDAKFGKRLDETKTFGSINEEWNESAQGNEDATTHIIKWSFTDKQLKDKADALKNANKLEDKGDYYANKEAIVTWVRYAHLAYDPATDKPAIGSKADKGNPAIWVKLTIPAGEFHVAKGDMGANKILTYWYALNSKNNSNGSEDAYEVRVNVPVPVPNTSATEKTMGYSIADNATPLNIRYDNLLEEANETYVASQRTDKKYSEFTKNLKDFFIGGQLKATVKDNTHFGSITGMKLGCEFILPNKELGNASFNAGKNTGKYNVNIDNSWTVTGYSGAEYTLILNADRTKIQIKAKNNTVYPTPVDLITLNYDENTTVTDRQITVLNYVNGVDQDDILNYKTHNELGERESFTAYINIMAIDACAPVYWNDMWFNVRFIRPLDLEDPKQGLVPDAPNDWHEVDLIDALIVKDWREYYGDRLNRTGGADIKLDIPVGSTNYVKAFDFAYYQVDLEINEGLFYTDAHFGKDARGVYEIGKMPTIAKESEAKAKNYIKTSEVPNLKFEKISKTKLRYLNNSGVTGGFHVFVPISMTYVYGYMTVRQTKWVTIGVTSSVEQDMIGQ